MSAADAPGHTALIVFTRYPEPGMVKTRLIPLLGPQGAADLQRRLTEHTLGRLSELANQPEPGIIIEVRYDGGPRSALESWLGASLRYRPQGKGSLGAKLARAFREAFARKAGSVLAVGTDCPGIAASHIRDAIEAIRDHDLVLGPAIDGGYYLIGLGVDVPDLFQGIPWGTQRVLDRTIEIAVRLGLGVHQLEPLDDVDRPRDLPAWERERRRG